MLGTRRKKKPKPKKKPRKPRLKRNPGWVKLFFPKLPKSHPVLNPPKPEYITNEEVLRQLH
jgi:hypothetical protein